MLAQHEGSGQRMRLLAPVLAAILATGASGCAPRVKVASGFDCYSMPAYPPMEKEVRTSSELVAWYFTHATVDQMRITAAAAAMVESKLSLDPDVDVENSFFRSQLLLLEDICIARQDDGRGLGAVTFAELQAASLIRAADLRDETPEIIASVVPSDSPNLTAGANIIILAAGCSTREHPLLAQVLAKRNLACGLS